MEIFTAPGEKVRYIGFHGSEWDREQAAKVLDTETEYEVVYVRVENWSSDVQLKGIPGSFNTVMFENVSDNPELNKDEMKIWGRKIG